jgi:hypothetical protein
LEELITTVRKANRISQPGSSSRGDAEFFARLKLHAGAKYWMKQGMKAFLCVPLVWFALNMTLPSNKAFGDESPCRYESPKLLTATIYEANSEKKRVQYKFRRTATRTNNTVTAVREFTDPDGKIAARERAVYEGDNLVSYELEELQINARGTAKLQHNSKGDGKIFFEYTTGNNKKTVDTESLRPDTLVNDMIGPFLAAHWDDLMNGEDVKCRYIAAARAETVGFKFAKYSDSMRDGKPVVVIKMSASSFIIATLVDPLYFTMEKDGKHRVLQYDGRTTPKLKDGNKWKDLDAVTVFDWN